MTRSNLLRFAQITAAALGAVILAAALAQSTRAGLASTARLLAVISAAGAVASLGWHGTAAAIERHEEHKRAERRHRVPRPDRGAPRPPSMPGPRNPAAGAYPDPYQAQRSENRPAPGPAGVDPYEDLYAHPSTSTA